MTRRPTGNQRTDAKNKLGLSGIAPVDPAGAESLPWNDTHGHRSMRIITPGGTPVRATHPGVVGRVELSEGAGVVEIVATEGALNSQTRKESAFTRYDNLGSIVVGFGQKVIAGQQIGTVSFFNLASAGAQGMGYQVFKNGYGYISSEAEPTSAEGIAIVKAANPDGIAPNQDEILRKEVSATTNGVRLAEDETPGTTSAIPSKGLESPNPPYTSFPQVNYRELVNQVYSHDFLIFISGVDVTKYMTGQLQISLVDKDGWNEASFSLNNASNNFVITRENLGINGNAPKFRTGNNAGEDKYSERAKKELMEYKNDLKRNPYVDVEKMEEVLASSSQGIVNVNATGMSKAAVGNQTEDIAISSREELGRKSVGGQVSTRHLDRRWPIGYQSTVLHKNDPIRIFRKNPLREADEWMPAFTGYLENISYDTNYHTGVSNVKITCYDIRAFAQKKRIQTTAVIGVTNPRSIFKGPPGSVDSVFTDLLDPSINGHPLAGRRFEDVMEYLITGTATQDPDLSSRFGNSGYSRGLGDFTLGDKIYYKPGDFRTGEQPDPLEHWHALCLFGMDGRTVNRGDNTVTIKQGRTKTLLGAEMNRRWITESEARRIGKETAHDGEWAPHKMFVHFLLPAGGTGAKNLLDFDALNADTNKLDFRSVLDVMQDFANRIDYQFWVTPMGDFVVEFPQYDFFPKDYGEYSTVFTVNRHLQSDNIQDEAGDIVTAIIAHGRISAINEADIDAPFQPKAVVVAPLMMGRYGVVEHELSLPYIADSKSLKRLAVIEFQKKLSEANKMDLQFDYRPFITPNRPIENFERQRMAVVTAIQNSLDLFKSGSTSVTSRYVRRSLLREDGTLGYTLITGNISMPISYRQIYGAGTESSIGSGFPRGRSTLKVATSPINPAASTGTGITTTNPIVTNSNKVTVSAINQLAMETGLSDESRGRFLALAQQMSGFNPEARNASTGGYGLFQLREDARKVDPSTGALGIGDSSDSDDQITASLTYFTGLSEKYRGNLDAVVAEFSLGIDKVKNSSVVQAFQDGFGRINKELGVNFQQLTQTISSGFNKLFPGEIASVDTTVETASDDTLVAMDTAETDGPVPSSSGFQGNMGVIVFDISREQSRSTTESAVEKQVRESNG